MNKNKLIISVVLLILLACGFYLIQQKNNQEGKQNPTNTSSSQSLDIVKILSVKPTDNSTILPTQPIEITFTSTVKSLEDFKHVIDPKFEYEMKLSEDKKTVTITPKISYPLGVNFALFIKPDTLFDDGKKLEGETIYHFKTIQYKGI